jgi:GT2 family glycosyltransferase
MRRPFTTVVVCFNEGGHVERTVACLRSTMPADAELIVVDDGSTDLSTAFLERGRDGVRLIRTDGCGTPRARNYGARAASGDVIVFADAHIETPRDWWIPLVGALTDPTVGAAAPAIYDMNNPIAKGFGLRVALPDLTPGFLFQRGEEPYAVPLLPGCCLAIRREVFEAIGGFDEGLIDWGLDDAEISLRLWFLGYDLRLIPRLEVGHLFRDVLPYRVTAGCMIHNKLRVALVHFSQELSTVVVDALRPDADFDTAWSLLARDDIAARRAELQRRRRRDDAAYFDCFKAFD